MTETEHPPGTTLYRCPLPACDWTYAQAPPDPFGVVPVTAGASLDETISRISEAVLREWYAESEAVLEAHMGTHATLEWVAEINRLTRIMSKVALDLADSGRIGRTLRTDTLPNANIARGECLDLLREGIASDRHQNLVPFVAALEQEQGAGERG